MIIKKDFVKVLQVADNIIITVAGNVSDNQILYKLIKAELKLKEIRSGRRLTVHEAANFTSGIIYEMIRNPYAPGIVHLLMAGFDDDGMHVYDLSPGGEIIEVDNYEASGSGSIFMYGYLDSHYREGMSVKEGVDLVVSALQTAMQRDSASGNGIKVYSVTKDGIKEEVVKKARYELTA